jgi:hypothetical protein
VLHHPIRPDPVRRAVGQRQIVRVPVPEQDLGPVRVPPPGLGEHGGVPVDPDDQPLRPHHVGQGGQVGARPAPDVHHRLPGPHLEQVEKTPLVVGAGRGGCRGVQVGDLIHGTNQPQIHARRCEGVVQVPGAL